MSFFARRISLVLSLLSLIAGLAGAQANNGNPPPPTPSTVEAPLPIPDGQPLLAAQSQPQIAFRFLKDYADSQMEKDKERDRINGWIGLAVGGLLTVGGIVELGIAGTLTGADADSAIQAGSITALAGLAITPLVARPLLFPLDRYKEYQLVLVENDLVVRESMAAATLKEFSDQGKAMRTSSAFISLALSVAISGLSAGLEVARGNPWYSGFANNPAIPVVAASFLLGGCYGLMITTPDEQRYQKYLAARNAVYSLPNQGQ